MGVDQNACTRSYVEGYWGKTGAKLGQKSNFPPRITPKITPKSTRAKWAGVEVCDSVTAICHTMRTPWVHPKKFVFQPTPFPRHVFEKRTT